MVDTLWTLLLFAGLGGMACVATVLVVCSWAPAASRRGSSWAMEGLVILIGPVHLTTEFLFEYGGLFVNVQTAARVLEICLVLLVAVQALRKPRRSARGLLLLLVIYLVALALSAFFGATSYLPQAYILSSLGIIAFVANGAVSVQAMLMLARASLRAVMVISLVALLFVPDAVVHTLQGRTLFGLPQFEGITQHPNSIGFMAALGLLIEISTHGRWLFLLISAATLVGAQSSTGYLIAIIGALVLYAYRCGASMRAIATGGVLLAPFIYVGFDTLTYWLPSDMSTLTGRTVIWKAALSVFDRYPVFGYGPSLLDEQFRYDTLGPTFDAAGQAHNQFVQDLAGAGVIGLLALVALVVGILVRAIRWSDDSNGLTLALGLALLGRMIVETPLRPTGLGPGLYVLVLTLGVIAVWERRPDAMPISENQTLQKPRVVDRFSSCLQESGASLGADTVSPVGGQLKSNHAW